MGGDLFWQHGDKLSTGLTHDDTNTIYYGSADWTGLVTNHIAAINAKYGGTTPTNPTTSTTKPPVATTTAPTSTAPAQGTVPKWGQCGGEGYIGSKVCVSGSTCTFSNQWYSQCL